MDLAKSGNTYAELCAVKDRARGAAKVISVPRALHTRKDGHVLSSAHADIIRMMSPAAAKIVEKLAASAKQAGRKEDEVEGAGEQGTNARGKNKKKNQVADDIGIAELDAFMQEEMD
ncbi:unnamed protein product, partial [Amoebophrya sp. A120]|eukprot:GSA120T00011091001.1